MANLIDLKGFGAPSALQAHFFKKSPFGDLQLQNGRQKKKFSRQKKSLEGEDTL